MRCRNHHSLTFKASSASTNSYKCRFVPQTIRNWDVLPDFLISAPEVLNEYVYFSTILFFAIHNISNTENSQ